MYADLIYVLKYIYLHILNETERAAAPTANPAEIRARNAAALERRKSALAQSKVAETEKVLPSGWRKVVFFINFPCIKLDIKFKFLGRVSLPSRGICVRKHSYRRAASMVS